ncbi:Gfo/Idh/MocA family oxidoreductase [soil metagenome]
MKSIKQPSKSRRVFLRQAGAAIAGAVTAPAWFSQGHLLAHPSVLGSNERIQTGHIGVGNQGKGNLKKLVQHAVAVCEVDSERLGQAKDQVAKAMKRSCATFSDYRKLLDSKDVDAVVITTPDHWHAQITVDACAAGKDVYCEKPLTLTVAEGRAMVNAARKHQRIVQTGSQQRSDDRFRLACELVRSGRLGKIETVRCGISGVNMKCMRVADSEPPAVLGYDFWLGPAPKRPYNLQRVHYNFRFFWDYSGGQMTNWGAHHLDIAQWGLGMDDSGPVSIEGKARYPKDGLYEVPEWCEIVYRYDNGVTMICGQSQKGGTTFVGAKGSIHVNRKEITSKPGDITEQALGEKDVHLYASKDHHANWLDCIKSRKLPICDVEIGHRSATVCHLGNIAVRTGRKLTWDPVKETIVGDDEAAGMLSRPYRAPWKLG